MKIFKRMVRYRDRKRRASYIIREIGGVRFKIPVIGGQINKNHEPWIISILSVLMRLTEGAVIDVGVNLGQTLLNVASIDRTRRILGFEPNATCVDFVQRLIDMNELNVEIIPAGLGNMSSVFSLQIYQDDTDSRATIIEGFRGMRSRSRSVAVLAFSDIPDKRIPSPVGIIKIDVEGAEADVIDGLKPLIERDRPYMLVEILPCHSEEDRARIDRQEHIEKTLVDLDYKKVRVHHVEELLLEPIDKIGIHGSVALSDYLMVPSEKLEKIVQSFTIKPKV
ncbi:FkbM family methyltransferase [Novosphingopyxis sp.]|uniref:FkbM family methyltransferase n=1 Tax=Novosphingopyxis sp. TaxID=2709690 RepID=UPI003B59CDA1